MWKETKGSSLSCILTVLYHSAKRLTHPACRLTFQHTTCVRFLNQTDSVLLCESDCVLCFCSMWESPACLPPLSVNFYPLTQPVWWTHSSCRHVLGRQTGGGPYGCSFLKSLNIHCHGSFDPCTVTLTPRMTILWCGEPRRGRLWKPHVVKLWEQHAPNEAASQKWRREHVGDTWEFLRAQVTDCAAYLWYRAMVPNLFILPQLYQKGLSTHTLCPFDRRDSVKELFWTFLLQGNHSGCGGLLTHVKPYRT